MNRCRNSYVEQALLPQRLEELTGEEAGQDGYRVLLQDSLDALLKEAKDKFRGYDSCSTPEHAELAYRKVSEHCVYEKILKKKTSRHSRRQLSVSCLLFPSFTFLFHMLLWISSGNAEASFSSVVSFFCFFPIPRIGLHPRVTSSTHA